MILLYISVIFTVILAQELQKVKEEEFLKMINEEQYVVALFCPSSAMHSCAEFEGVLTSIREDMIEVMDGKVLLVKLVDSPMVEEYVVSKTEKPLIVMFRSGLPVLHDG